jgi:flavodoxin
MKKTLIVSESKYGTTEKVGKYLSLVLGPASYCKTSEFNDQFKDFDFIIIGSPIYKGELDPRVSKFVHENLDWLKNRQVALFCTCLNIEDGNKSLEKMGNEIGNVSNLRALGGVLKLDDLTEEDSRALESFSEMFGFDLEDMDNFNPEKVIDYALELKNIQDELVEKIPQTKLKDEIEEFLLGHNTCTLSTSYKERVRSTPIEYTYHNGFIYLLSEGGEKFANILLNNKVSIAIYEDYTGMNNLAGMQITGHADIILKDEDGYEKILQVKGLNPEYIKKMPVNLNIIEVKIEKIEFLYSKFKNMGYEARQILNLND